MFKREEVIPYSKDQDIVFQIISWHACDQEDDDDNDEEESNMINKKYLVKIFGVTESGISVSANLTDFPPFFYIKSPINLNDFQVKMIKEFIVEKLHYKQKNSIQEVRAMKKKDFWGFTNNTKFTFVRISCKNLECFRAAARIFQKKVMIPAIWNKDLYFKLYESNIEPFLRLAHIRNINPAGWVKIPAKYHTAIKTSRCQIDVTCRWSAIESVQLEKMAPFVIASFDIECTSSHGDFPVANKNYKKTAIELINLLNNGFTKDSLMQEILNIFNHNTPGKLSKIFTKKEVTDFNITMLKRNMDDIYALLNNKIKFTSSTRDSTIKQLTETLTNILPTQEGDPIIQIGTTVHKYGDKECAYKNIITLGTCSDITDADVMVCNNEKELLLKWKQLINRLDPDVLIGYNIFGFDMSYMYERARELKIDKSFCEIGRLLDHESPYVEKALSSSALGDNLLKYIDMEGRVLIDIMKLVQRDHKLDSYKLDTVASSFLGGKVIGCSGGGSSERSGERVVIDNIKGISVDSYIKFSDNDQKYKILSINVLESTGGYEITLDQPLTTKETKWGLAKDDITPRQIFESQNGTADDRAMIAKYCIKDCALCNYLLMKLETLANNVGMANVCSVPLSFIFMRGQGIKIFSLVAKQCRDDDYLIPCLNKYKPPNAAADDEDEDEEGYEGAIVLEPKEGIYIDDPIAVLDYASLYPSSMISENLSHDCIVLDPKYDNLEGLEYLDIAYDIYEKVNEKKVKTGERVCRYVQLPEKGIIPRILMHLLKQRKVTRKKIEFKTVITEDGQSISGLMKDSGDSVVINDVIIDRSVIKSITDTYDDFQKAVLDGLQLAYKVTANSLYGQCGAKTSQIYMKDIAACTTATGRKMIMMARDFIEKNYPAETIYGDSVTGDTPLIIKFKDGLIDIITIECLTKEWVEYPGFKVGDIDRYDKEQSFLDAEVWTDGKWAKIHRVIRHKCNKKLYRVNTFKGCIDVTEDHSLIDINGEKIKPMDCIEDETELMHSFPDEFNETVMEMREYKCDKFMKLPEECESEYKCKCCGEMKPPGEFYYCNKSNGNGYFQTARCKLCVKIKTAERKGKTVDTTKVNTKILNYKAEAKVITKEEAWVWGIFFGDGSCGSYECESGGKKSWALNNTNLKYLNRTRDYLLMCESREIVSDFKILDTIESSGVYKLSPVGSPAYMVEKYRDLFYDKDKHKKVPQLILNASKEIREWFLEGYLTADGAKKEMNTGGLSFACKGKIGAQGLYYIAKSIGWTNLRINIQSYKENTYWIYHIRGEQYYDENQNKLKKMFDIFELKENDENCEDDEGEEGDKKKPILKIKYNRDDYVYDIETSAGRFHGGVGEIVVVNTDSLFVKFTLKDGLGNQIRGKDAILPSIEMAMDASKQFKKYLKPPHDAEYEKTFYPFILFSKKRYCANKYEYDDKKCKMNSMGIVLKRRDNAQIVKTIYGGVLNIILNEQNIRKSIEFMKDTLKELIEGKYPLSELIVSKSLKSDYKDPDKIAHKMLADRMGERDEGNRPQANDRIPYVYVQMPPAPKGKKILQGERIEHPDYIIENSLKPDYEFYITNQIMKPCLQLYALVLEQLDGYKKNVDYTELKERLIKEKDGDLKKAKDRWHDLREEHVKKLLFEPILTKLTNKKNNNREITDYFKRVADE